MWFLEVSAGGWRALCELALLAKSPGECAGSDPAPKNPGRVPVLPCLLCVSMGLMRRWEHVVSAPERNSISGLHSGHGSNPGIEWERCKPPHSCPPAAVLQSHGVLTEASQAGLGNHALFKIN